MYKFIYLYIYIKFTHIHVCICKKFTPPKDYKKFPSTTQIKSQKD